MIPITDNQRKVIFELFKCYSESVFHSKTDFYCEKSGRFLKMNFLKLSEDSLMKFEPFKDFTSKVSATIENRFKRHMRASEQELLKLGIMNDINDLLIREIQLFNVSIKGGFSLKREYMSKEMASKFIDFMLGYFMEHNLTISEKLQKMLERQEMDKLCFLALLNKKCSICGREITGVHHVDRVGTGGYEHDKGTDKRISPLCQFHHAEVELMGESNFSRKYGDSYMYILCDDNQIEALKKVYKHHFKAYKKEEE